MMRKVNILAAVASAACLFGSGDESKVTPTPSEGAIQYIHSTKEVEALLKNKQDVLVFVTAPFRCGPCEILKKMFKENEKALLALQGSGVQIRFNDPAYQDTFTQTWEKGSLMRDSLIAPAVRGYPSLLWFKSEGDVSDAGKNVNFDLLKRMPDGGRRGDFWNFKLEQWATLVKIVTERRAAVEKDTAELKAKMPFDQTAVPTGFSGFVIFVDNDENRYQMVARKYAARFDWTKTVEGLNYGPLLFVKDEKKAGMVALYIKGEPKVMRGSFVPQVSRETGKIEQPLEQFAKCIRDAQPKTPVLEAPKEEGEKVEKKAECTGEKCCEGDKCS